MSNNVFKSASIYLGFNVVVSAIPFFMLPVFTRYMSTSDYGSFALYLMLTSVFLSFIGVSSNTYCESKYHESNEDNYVTLIANSFLCHCYHFCFSIYICAFLF